MHTKHTHMHTKHTHMHRNTHTCTRSTHTCTETHAHRTNTYGNTHVHSANKHKHTSGADLEKPFNHTLPPQRVLLTPWFRDFHLFFSTRVNLTAQVPGVSAHRQVPRRHQGARAAVPAGGAAVLQPAPPTGERERERARRLRQVALQLPQGEDDRAGEGARVPAQPRLGALRPISRYCCSKYTHTRVHKHTHTYTHTPVGQFS